MGVLEKENSENGGETTVKKSRLMPLGLGDRMNHKQDTFFKVRIGHVILKLHNAQPKRCYQQPESEDKIFYINDY